MKLPTSDTIERDETYPWLADLCYTFGNKYRAPIAGIEAFGKRWTVATNGQVMCFMPDGHSHITDDGEFAANIARIVATWPTTNEHVFQLADLKDTLGAPAEVAECATCDGERTIHCDECDDEGEIECTCTECDDVHYRRCGECGGKGGKPCPDCGAPDGMRADDPQVRLFGVGHFNPKLLRFAIQNLPNSTVTFRQDGDLAMAGFDGGDWRLCVMPVRRDSYSSRTVISFPATDETVPDSFLEKKFSP